MTDDDDGTEQLRVELARQDEALERAREQLEAMAGLDVRVPASWLRELEDASAPRAFAPIPLVSGIRA